MLEKEEAMVSIDGAQFPISQPLGVLEEEREAEERIVEEQEKQD